LARWSGRDPIINANERKPRREGRKIRQSSVPMAIAQRMSYGEETGQERAQEYKDR
jgi:hypothetical protein